jgi:hypothetical protein
LSWWFVIQPGDSDHIDGKIDDEKVLLGDATLLALPCAGTAATFAENSDGAFPAWESGFIDTQSNLQNVFGPGSSDNGGSPALSIDDGDRLYSSDKSDIAFNALFGASITSINFKLSAFVNGITLGIYDMSKSLIYAAAVTADGSFNPVLSYGTTSTNGVSRFSFSTTGFQVEGNTRIDAIEIVTGVVSNVPLPGAPPLAMIGMGALNVAGLRRRRKA